MHIARLIIAGLLATASGPLFAQSAQDPQYLVEARAAKQHHLDCFGGADDTACMAMIAAFQRAMQAPDATDAARHELKRQILNVVTVRGGNLRRAGKPQQALDALGPGFEAMMQHFEGGKHFHAIIDGLGLQEELLLSLAELGRMQEVDAVLANARTAADVAFEQRQAAEGNEQAAKLVHQAIVSSERLEKELARTFRDKSRVVPKDQAPALRKRALEAYARAEVWLRRSQEAGVRGAMDLRGELRLAELLIEQGSLQLDEDADKLAEEQFLAASVACLLQDPVEAREFGFEPLKPQDVPVAKSLCERARLGWGLATGAAYRQIERATQEMIDRELGILKQSAGG